MGLVMIENGCKNGAVAGVLSSVPMRNEHDVYQDGISERYAAEISERIENWCCRGGLNFRSPPY